MSWIRGFGRRRAPLSLLLCGLLCAAWLPAFAQEAPQDPGTEPPGAITFVGGNLVSTANGVFHRWRVVESQIDPQALEASSALIEVELASVDTGIDMRDEHLREADFFEVETYPVARVRVHSARQTEDETRYTLRFDVDLHGVKKTLDGEVRLTGRDPLRFEGAVTLDRTDFGIGNAPSRWNPMSPKAEIPVRFHIEF